MPDEREHEQRRGEERRRVERERQRRRPREQGGSDRRAGQVAGNRLGHEEAGVGPFDLLGVDQAGQDRLGRVVEEDLARSEQERHDPDETDRLVALPHRDREQADGDAAAGVDDGHHPAPVEPVGHDPAEQAEHQPRQPPHDFEPGDERRVRGQAGDEQRHRREDQAVADERDRRGRPHLVEPRPQGLPLHRRKVSAENPGAADHRRCPSRLLRSRDGCAIRFGGRFGGRQEIRRRADHGARGPRPRSPPPGDVHRLDRFAGAAPPRVGGRRQRRRRGDGRLRDPHRRHAARRRWLPGRRRRSRHSGRGASALQGTLGGRDRDDDAARGRQVRRRRLQGLRRSARRRRLGGQRAVVAPRARGRPRRQHLPAGVRAGEEGHARSTPAFRRGSCARSPSRSAATPAPRSRSGPIPTCSRRSSSAPPRSWNGSR